MGYDLHDIPDSVQAKTKEKGDMKLFRFTRSGFSVGDLGGDPVHWSESVIIVANYEEEARRLLDPGFFFKGTDDFPISINIKEAEIKPGIIF